MKRTTTKTMTVVGALEVLKVLKAEALAQVPEAPRDANDQITVDAGSYGGLTPIEDCDLNFRVEWMELSK